MKLSPAMHEAVTDAYKRMITDAEDQRVKCAPNTLAALRRRGFVYSPDTTIAFQLTPEGFKYGEEWEDTTPAPCHPIGCDNGYHLSGCQFAVIDSPFTV